MKSETSIKKVQNVEDALLNLKIVDSYAANGHVSYVGYPLCSYACNKRIHMAFLSSSGFRGVRVKME